MGTWHVVQAKNPTHLLLVRVLFFRPTCTLLTSSRSSSLVSKPKDWGLHLKIAGFSFLPLALSYVPPPELISFLQAGSCPIYIGFGSIVVEDPQSLTAIIFDATRLAGVRAVVSQGWGGLGELVNIPSNIFMVGDCPHNWLFTQVSCVVHHGGAGTTAAGLAAGKPSVVVPFFGDQDFWGKMVAQAGAGPQPVPFRTLSASDLAAAIISGLEPAVSHNASLLATNISAERGSETATRNFQEQLPLRLMACSLEPRRPAIWRHRPGEIKISALAATVLRRESLIHLRDLELSVYCM
jgi:UDP:flavonoid glycosyltransferase YjiC (YdhE family)